MAYIDFIETMQWNVPDSLGQLLVLILIWLILHNETRRNGDKKWDVPDCLSQPSTTCVQNLSRLADQPDLTDMRFALRFTQVKFFYANYVCRKPKIR